MTSILTGESQGNGNGPWWVKAIKEVGITAALLAFVLWWALTSFDTRLTAMSIEQSAMFRLLQQICVNTSTSPEQRTGCWNPWR